MPWLDSRPSGYYIIDRNPRTCQALGKVSYKEARALLDEYRVARRKAPGGHYAASASAALVFAEYMAEVEKSLSVLTIKTKWQTVGYFLETVKTMGDITPEHLSWWKAEMFRRGLAVDTVALRLRDLRAWLGWCHREGKIRENPFTISIPQGRKDAGRDLTLAQFEAFLKALRDIQPERNRPDWLRVKDLAMRLAIHGLFSGARLGELLNARGEDVDRKARLWTIPKAKGDKKRVVPLREEVLAVLPKAKEGLLYPISPSGLRYLWKKAQKAAGIPGRLRFHDARHNFASFYMRSTGDWMGLMEICGWSSPAMAKRYTHLGRAHLVSKIDQMRIG